MLLFMVNRANGSSINKRDTMYAYSGIRAGNPGVRCECLSELLLHLPQSSLWPILTQNTNSTVRNIGIIHAPSRIRVRGVTCLVTWGEGGKIDHGYQKLTN